MHGVSVGSITSASSLLRYSGKCDTPSMRAIEHMEELWFTRKVELRRLGATRGLLQTRFQRIGRITELQVVYVVAHECI
jgi:hypothetical protein